MTDVSFRKGDSKKKYGTEMEVPVNGNRNAIYDKVIRGDKKKLFRDAHNDGENVYEIKSIICKEAIEIAEFTILVLRALTEAGGVIHSYPVYSKKFMDALGYSHEKGRDKWCCRLGEFDGKKRHSSFDPSSNHLHFSKLPNYDAYLKLFNLIHIFKFFFKNSPHLHSVKKTLSIRHEKDIIAFGTITKKPMTKVAYNASRDRYNEFLTPNYMGGVTRHTLEFRYNDLSKSPMQPSMYFYLAYIAKVLETLDKSKKKYPKIIIKNFKFGEQNTLNLMKRSREDLFEVAEKIAKIPDLRPIKFYNFYTNSYQKINEVIREAFDFEVEQYESFHKVKEWSDFWRDMLDKYKIPKVLAENEDSGEAVI